MAEIIQNEGVTPQGGKRRAKLQPAHVDMTPMVDLACLLLTFFMLTTAFTKPKIMEIIMPGKGKPKPIDEARVLNIILAEKDQVYFYYGLADPSTGKLPTMIKSNTTDKGIRKVLQHRNKELLERVYYYNDSISKGLGNYTDLPKDTLDKRLRKMRTADKKGPIVLIKAAEGVKYGLLVNILNEMAITNVARYAVVDINKVEEKMLKHAIAGINVEAQ
jgi:biopolymer transport protein ExbD